MRHGPRLSPAGTGTSEGEFPPAQPLGPGEHGFWMVLSEGRRWDGRWRGVLGGTEQHRSREGVIHGSRTHLPGVVHAGPLLLGPVNHPAAGHVPVGGRGPDPNLGTSRGGRRSRGPGLRWDPTPPRSREEPGEGGAGPHMLAALFCRARRGRPVPSRPAPPGPPPGAPGT